MRIFSYRLAIEASPLAHHIINVKIIQQKC
nr:MAG TPA: hypothetical protein [Caudoviricetes sp.]DAV16433.1 MAG TPA: hypothetical protein [Caudoviricetes sp.]